MAMIAGKSLHTLFLLFFATKIKFISDIGKHL